DHLRARFRDLLAVDLAQLRALAQQKLACPLAVRTPARQVDQNARRSHAVRSLGLGKRQILGAPGGQTAAQIEGLGKSLGRELPHRGSREGAAVVVYHDRLFLVLLQSIPGLEDLIAAHLARAGEVAARERLGRTQIDEQGAVVHQPDQILRRDRGGTLVTRTQLVEDHEGCGDCRPADIPWVVCDVFQESVHASFRVVPRPLPVEKRARIIAPLCCGSPPVALATRWRAGQRPWWRCSLLSWAALLPACS